MLKGLEKRYRQRHPDRIKGHREQTKEHAREYQSRPEVKARRNKLARLGNIARIGHQLGYANIPVNAEFERVEKPHGEESTVEVGQGTKEVPYHLGYLGTGEIHQGH
jgi:hypothetical protein